MRKRFSLIALLLASPCFAQSLPAAQVWQQAKQKPEQAFSGEVTATGAVKDTGISRFLTPVVEVSDRAGGKTLINCVLPRRNTTQLSALQAGDAVQVAGRYHGFFSEAVVLKECRVEKI